MAQPYIGEIRMFAGNYAPAGWAFCDGAPLAISENDALFQLIGTTYGGDGQETFGLPDLASRVPIGSDFAGRFPLGVKAGTESETLTVQQIPVHDHAAYGSLDPGTQTSPQNAIPGSFAVSVGALAYGSVRPFIQMSPRIVSPAGGSQPHDNCQPSLCVNFIISLYGIFPSPT